MKWGDYTAFDPGVWGLLRDIPRGEAKAVYERRMASKAERLRTLGALLHANGLELGRSNQEIQELDDWFRSSVEPDPGNPERLRPIWYSVVNDIALFLGDVIIGRAPNLQWQFFGKFPRDLAYQRHVIMGFPVANSNYNLDIDRVIATVATRHIMNLPLRPDEFVQAVESAVAKAQGVQV